MAPEPPRQPPTSMATPETTSRRELELEAKNEILSRTSAELAAEVFRLKQHAVAATAAAAAGSPQPQLPSPPKTSPRARKQPKRAAKSPPLERAAVARDEQRRLRSRSPRSRDTPPPPSQTQRTVDTQVPTGAGDAEELGSDAQVYSEAQTFFADKVRAEAQLEKTRLELRLAEATNERQRLELETLRGRSTGLRVARETATHVEQRPWERPDNFRFHKVPATPPNKGVFSDDLRDLLDLAVLATSKRVNEALANAANARLESERACEQSNADLEERFLAHDPARIAARALLVQTQRSSKVLRAASVKLEEEAANAQSTNAADVNSLRARLSAQRDAQTACLHATLKDTEQDYTTMFTTLSDRLKTFEASSQRDLAARDETISELREQLTDTELALHKEKAARAEECKGHEARISNLEVEERRLGQELSSTVKAWQEEKQRLALRLADETADKEAQLGERQRNAEAMQEAAKREREGLEAQLMTEQAERCQDVDQRDTAYAKLTAKSSNVEATLRAELQRLTLAKAESEDKLNEKYRRLEALKLQETTMLKNRVERLSKLQDAALNAGGSKARSLLYMASMKMVAKQGSSMSMRGEDDPTGVPEGALVPNGEHQGTE